MKNHRITIVLKQKRKIYIIISFLLLKVHFFFVCLFSFLLFHVIYFWFFFVHVHSCGDIIIGVFGSYGSVETSTLESILSISMFFFFWKVWTNFLRNSSSTFHGVMISSHMKKIYDIFGQTFWTQLYWTNISSEFFHRLGCISDPTAHWNGGEFILLDKISSKRLLKENHHPNDDVVTESQHKFLVHFFFFCRLLLQFYLLWAENNLFIFRFWFKYFWIDFFFSIFFLCDASILWWV